MRYRCDDSTLPAFTSPLELASIDAAFEALTEMTDTSPEELLPRVTLPPVTLVADTSPEELVMSFTSAFEASTAPSFMSPEELVMKE